jgi:iron complex transport system substrate-binding protein
MRDQIDIRRRALLLGTTCTLLARGRVAHALAATPRVAAIDWAMLETAMALGVTPVAATELIQFAKDAVEPAIPHGMVDLGLRGSPNFELLHLTKPDLILSSPFYTRQQPALEAIAPVVSLPFYVKGEMPFDKALSAVQELGRSLGRDRQASLVIGSATARLDDLKARLAGMSGRPVYLINIGDARHFRAFGNDSMFGDVATRLGLDNAWSDRSRFSFAAPVPLESLAERPDARIVIISDVPVEARRDFRDSMIWNRLEPVRQKRVTVLPNINPYGGIVAAMRFARLLGSALEMGSTLE